MQSRARISLFLAAVSLAVPASVNATTLTFDGPSWPGINQYVPQAYGDNIANPAVVDGNGYTYGTGGGATPNVAAQYGGGSVPAPNVDPSTSYAYGGLQGVVVGNYAPSDGSSPIIQLTLTADPGYQITLESFDLGGYLATGNNYGVNISVVDSINGLLYSQTNLSIQGGPSVSSPHDTFLPNVAGQSLTLAIYTGNARGNLALDNVRFSQSVVPEPASASLLALGLVGLAARRKR
jgi:hypothetical protein